MIREDDSDDVLPGGLVASVAVTMLGGNRCRF